MPEAQIHVHLKFETQNLNVLNDVFFGTVSEYAIRVSARIKPVTVLNTWPPGYDGDTILAGPFELKSCMVYRHSSSGK